MEDAAFTIIWVSLALYALLAGADFGVGVWVLVSYLTRGGERLREAALGYFGPVWEVNTLFLVFFMVGLISAFPRAIGVLGHALIPLVLAALVMFVIRSGAYAWMHHGPKRGRGAATTAIGVSSVAAGLGLGYAAAAPASGLIRGDTLADSFYTSSVALAALPLTLTASAHLAALAVAAYADVNERRATDWYRLAALAAGALVLPFTALFTLAIRADVPHTADRLERALATVIERGESVTYDMKPTRDDPTAVGTSDVADAVIEEMERVTA